MNKDKDFIVVTDPPFNAVGGGMTDDAKAFQDAVNSLPGGGTIMFPREEGRAAITTPLGSRPSNGSE
jgi:polygalacturonase